MITILRYKNMQEKLLIIVLPKLKKPKTTFKIMLHYLKNGHKMFPRCFAKARTIIHPYSEQAPHIWTTFLRT